MKKLAALILATSVAGCSSQSLTKFQSGLVSFNDKVATYAPIVGKDILLVGNILVTAECSPAMGLASQAATNVLTITAPTSSSASKAESILATNMAIAQQLCPLVTAIQAQIGAVPAGAKPTQTVPAA